MAVDGTDRWEADEKRRRQDQVRMVRRGNPLGVVVVYKGEHNELPVMLVPDHVLVETRGRSRFENLVNDPKGAFVSNGSAIVPADNPVRGVLLYQLPQLKNPKRKKAQFLDA